MDEPTEEYVPQPLQPISGWIIRPYRPGDEHDLVTLFDRAFGHAITEAHWRWKLKGLPSPVENVWLAVHDDKPIFHYGGIPCRFHLPGGEQIAMISVDGMTAPEFRRRGVLTEVGRFVYDTWRDAGIPFTIGLPNEQWGSRTQALGWEPLFPFQWLVRLLRPATAAARRLGLPAPALLHPAERLWDRLWHRKTQPDAAVEVHRVDQADAAFDQVWQTCRPDLRISIVRDSQWVNWRYLAAPEVDYRVLLAVRAGRPVGYLAYRIKDTPRARLGFVAEVFTPLAEARGRATLLHHLVRALHAEDVDAILTLAVPQTPLFRAFRQAGFVFSRRAFTVQMIPFDPALPMSFFRNPRHWYLAGGDFDVV